MILKKKIRISYRIRHDKNRGDFERDIQYINIIGGYRGTQRLAG